MSKTSPKKRYEQLMSWLDTYKPSPKSKKKNYYKI
jgi:hypothetical protein